MTDKLECTECGWRGDDTTVCRVKDPGGVDIWRVCPDCRTPENMVLMCDEPDCVLPVTCGTPIPNGYRRTCGNHRPIMAGAK